MKIQTYAIIGAVSGLIALGYLGSQATHHEAIHAPDAHTSHVVPVSGHSKARLASNYGKLPLSFEVNQGQTDARVKYLSRGPGYTLFLTADEAVLRLSRVKDLGSTGLSPVDLPALDAAQEMTQAVLRMRLEGADSPEAITGIDQLAGTSNYFIGNDPEKWQKHVAQFGKVRYAGVYPGIDLVYYGNQRQLEFDFVVAPGADPKRIHLAYSGADKMEVDAQGNLILHVGDERVVQHKPTVYQQIGDDRHPVDGQFRLEQGQVGFELASYDTSRELIIDPVLVYATYFGGNGMDSLRDMKVDAAGNVYLGGYTASTNFPVLNALQPAKSGYSTDCVVAKLNPAGDALLYSTYLGGSGEEVCWSAAIDTAGSVYIGGVTHSTNLPVTAGAYQTAFAGFISDGFVSKLSPDGSSLVYSTYIGGSGSEDLVVGLDVDSSGSAYLGVRTTRKGSVGFPVTAGAYQTTSSPVVWEPAVAKLSPDGTSLIYSTFLNNGTTPPYSSQGHAHAIVVDAAGNAYVGGPYSTGGALTITPGSFQPTHHGGTWDAFVTKLSADGSSVLYSTFLGGSGTDSIGPNSLTVDAAGNLIIVSGTTSFNFPTVNPIQAAHGGGSYDGFVTKLNPTGTAAIFSTYLGGTANDGLAESMIDPDGNLLITGYSRSPNFPVTPDALFGANQGSNDGVIVKLTPDGQNILFSTYLGGPLSDYPGAIGMDAAGNVYVAGGTQGQFPVTPGAFQTVYGGGTADGLIAKLQLTPSDTTPPTGTISIDGGSGLTNSTSVTLSLTCDDGTGSGCDQMQFSNDGVTFSALQPFAASASWTLAAGDGAKTVYARFVDAAGNVSTPVSASITLDTMPPAAPVITSPANGSASQSTALTISGTAEPNALTTVRDGAASIGLVSADGAGNWNLAVSLSEGVHSFTAQATDGAGNQGPASATVSYTADGTPPVVTAPADITVAATGVLTPVTLGTATATDAVDGTLTPTPSATGPFARGVHTITWSATDSAGNTGTATQTVTVTNNAPVANADSATTNEDTPVTVTVLANDSDIDGGALSVASVTQGANGAVVINLDNTVTYTPNANFNGSDSFSYTISDGNGGTATATVNVTVTAVNDPPVAANDVATTDEDVPVTITVLANDTDADGDTLTVTGTTVPANGSVVINPDKTVTYTPNTDFNGSDAFTYTVSDGNGGTATATVNVTINAVNDAPTAKAVSNAATLPLGGTFLLDGTGSSDVDGDPIVSYAWSVFSAPAGSTAAIVGAGTATPSFTPDKIGDYLIVLVVSDGTLVSAADTLALTAAPNLPPVASLVASPVTGLKPLPVNFNATASSDPEGGPLTFEWVFGDGATATGPIVNHTYANAGTYTAELTVTDNLGNTDMASATITVTAPNLPPTVLPTATPSTGAPPLNVQFTAGATDPEGQPLSYSWTFGDGGTSTLADPAHTYTAAGTYTTTVTVSDGVNPPVSASLTISVGSALTINITQAKFDFGKKDEHKGKITFVADFTFAGLPAAGDLITASIDGEEIFSAPFGDFKQKKPGYYKIKVKDKKTRAQAFIDFSRGVLAVTRHKMDLSGIDNDNGVDVVISFGSATGTDHLKMKEKIKNPHDEKDEKEMEHKEHH
jgi:PKD repeat protein